MKSQRSSNRFSSFNEILWLFKGGKKADNSFKIHDGSDFDEAEDEMDSDSDDDKKKKKKEDSDDDQNTKKKGKGAGKKKKSKEDVKDEAFEGKFNHFIFICLK